MGGQGYRRYPNWAAMDMSSFKQDKTIGSKARPGDANDAGRQQSLSA